jgi:ATP-binding cassette subfamily F protein 3
MLTLADITYRVAGRSLLEDASAQITAGQRVALVGRNGSGKSTLLELIRGTLQPDSGDVQLQKGARLGFVAQEAPGGDQTPLDAVLAGDAERAALLHEAESATEPQRIAEIQARLIDIDGHAAPSRAAGILAGLGFDATDQTRPLASFSGGWRMRVALAAALFSQPDLLLLDEPTNHLDLEAALWLEEWLRRWPGTLIVVSHDRQLLNAVPSHILHLDQKRLTSYVGGFDRFVRTRRERLEHTAAQAAKQEAQRKHLQAFVDRFRAKASKARQAQSRIKALEKMQPIQLAVEEEAVTFAFPEPEELAPPLLTLDRVAVGYEPGKPVLRNLDLRLDPDDRIALLGANGNGKSTLAKLIAGRLQPMSGHETRHGKLRSGFFAQHQIEELDPESSPLQHLARLMPLATEAQVRARLGRFGFSQEKALVKAKDLSGGEKARLTFALVTHFAPPVLILDEPTNHLDLETREALVEAVNDFPGAVVLISHDWNLLETTADRLWLVANGTVKPFAGDLEEYRRVLLEERGADNANGADRRDPAPSRKDERRAAAERRRELEPLRRRARDAAKIVEQLEAEKRNIEAALAAPETYGDAKRTSDLVRRQGELAKRLAEAEEAWLEAESALEEAAAA